MGKLLSSNKLGILGNVCCVLLAFHLCCFQREEKLLEKQEGMSERCVLTMALVEDSCAGAGRKENLAKASVLAQNSEYYSFSRPLRRAFWSCDVG